MQGADFLPRHRRTALLSHFIATEIIPRMTLARQAEVNASQPDGAGALGIGQMTTIVDTEEVVRLLLTEEAARAVDFVDVLRLRGATPDSLYLGLLSEAARSLGRLWEADRCDFTQVTISVGRLQQIARGLAPAFQMRVAGHDNGYSALLLPAPGEQHTFGLLILAEFFQRDGWRVTGGPATAGEDPADMVRRSWVDVAGFSIGSSGLLDGLARCIHRVRRASCNRALAVLVGGPLFATRPDLVRRVGADAVAADAPGALGQARALLAMRASAD